MLTKLLFALLVAQAADPPLDVQADRMVYEEDGRVLEASGHVRLERDGVTIEAEALRLDVKTRQGDLTGPVRVKGGPFEVTAAGAHVDLNGETATLDSFSGQWQGKAKFAGDRLVVGRQVFRLENGWVTNCLAPHPDLALAARTFYFYPEARRKNLAGEGVALRVMDHDVLSLPYFNATVDDPDHNPLDATGLFPAFGFDAYRGFLTSTRFDFSLGENSRGTIPIDFSSGRGWSAGVDHALTLGPGEIGNAVMVETPWATGRGGLKVLNSYAITQRDGTRLEANADYRQTLNGQPVHRLPDLGWIPPSLNLGGLVTIHNEVRAGYLWEESSGQQATRLRWSAGIDTPIWSVLPWWQTWVSATPFVNHYVFSPYGGFASAWNHHQDWGHGLQTTQGVEFFRVYGQTPFLHDRLYDTERARAGATMDWSPAFFSAVSGSWSRLNQAGAFSVEDIAVTNTYRWNCFGFSLVLHPLVWGVETHLSAGMF